MNTNNLQSCFFYFRYKSTENGKLLYKHITCSYAKEKSKVKKISGTDIDYPHFSTLGQPLNIGRADSLSSQAVSATCHASLLQSTYVEPHVSALPVSQG